MNGNRVKKIVFAALIMLAGSAIFVYTLVNSLYFDANAGEDILSGISRSATTSEILVVDSIPVRLAIPSLNIDAPVVQVGVNPNGHMGTPSKFTDVGWYKYGTLPGNKGSAVLAGHVDNGLSLAGVFKHLESIQVGDRIAITRTDGSTQDFVVTKIDTFDYKNTPSEEIFNQNDASYVKLITCVGRWTASDKTYDKRLVVTARAL